MSERLRILRKTLNLTQQAFGAKIGLSNASIGNIENGVINLTDRNVSLICSAFNVNEDWLRYGEGDMFSPMTEDEEFSYLIGALIAEDCDYKKTFIKLMLKLEDEEDWKIVANLVEGLRRKNEKSRER